MLVHVRVFSRTLDGDCARLRDGVNREVVGVDLQQVPGALHLAVDFECLKLIDLPVLLARQF